jgi:predicted amidophosphoribosyltransferase
MKKRKWNEVICPTCKKKMSIDKLICDKCKRKVKNEQGKGGII